jgi:hypothetical protein
MTLKKRMISFIVRRKVMELFKHFIILMGVAVILGGLEGLIFPFPIVAVISVLSGLLWGITWSVIDPVWF